MKLFRITVKSDWRHHNKKRTYYVIQETREKAKEYITKHLRAGMVVDKISYLGEEYGSRLFGKGD